MKNRTDAVKLTIGSVAVLLPGCVRPPASTPYERQRGLVLVLPGIEGPSPWNASIARGLHDGGVDRAVEVYDWGTQAGVLTWWLHLAHHGRNIDQARELAEFIRDYRAAYPSAPIDLIGHSGGAGILLLALEQLPASVRVKSAVLLAAAVSPDYDLTRALGRTERGIWNFYSGRDVAFLGAGTVLFGTIDRAHTVAAGAVGFDTSRSSGDPAHDVYARKLHQVAYADGMAFTGNFGTHSGWASREFAREWLAPLVRSGAPPQPSFARTEAAPMLAADAAPASAHRRLSPELPTTRAADEPRADRGSPPWIP